MTSKHTPGPWELCHEYSVHKGDKEIALVWKGNTIEEKPEDEANARLIAAAPDLLSSLETALRHARESMDAESRYEFDFGGAGPEWMFTARAAIAKAKGG